MNRRSLSLAVCAAVVAANLFAAVSPQYRLWGDSAVQYLMMKQEKIDWASVRTDAEAKAFIDLFWARRDPTPDTPANELRQQIEARIADADKRFAFSNTPGSQTDKGMVYVLFGEPTQVKNSLNVPRVGGTDMTQFRRPVNVESWIYRSAAAQRVAGTTSFDVVFVFNDDKATGDFQLDGPSRQSFDSTALALAKTVLKQPFLTAADLASGASVRTVALGLIVVSDSGLANDILRRVQEGEKFADLARKYSSHHSAKDGGYVGRMPFAELGDDFKAALAGKEAGATVLIARSPQFAVVRLLTDAEVAAANVVIPKSN